MRVRAALLPIVPFLMLSSTARAQSTPPTQSSQPNPTPVPPTADDWTGVYFGGNLGSVSTTMGGPVTFASFASSGVTQPSQSITLAPMSDGSFGIGLQVGYMARLTQALVGGLELEITHASPTITQTAGTQATPNGYFIPTDSFTTSGGRVMLLRLRVGTGMTHGVFVYGALGAAFTTVTATGTFPAAGSLPAAAGTDSHLMRGLTVGVGAEFALPEPSLRGFTVGAEFRHDSFGTVAFDFANVNVAAPPVAAQPAFGAMSVSANQFEVRISYRVGRVR